MLIKQRTLNNKIEKLKTLNDEYTPNDEFQEEFEKIYRETTTTAEKIADWAALKFGSWIFLFWFIVFCIGWIVYNIFVKIDPFPYIFLTLILSMLAIICTVILQISQNRKDAKDNTRLEMVFEICQSIMIDIEEIKQMYKQK